MCQLDHADGGPDANAKTRYSLTFIVAVVAGVADGADAVRATRVGSHVAGAAVPTEVLLTRGVVCGAQTGVGIAFTKTVENFSLADAISQEVLFSKGHSS